MDVLADALSTVRFRASISVSMRLAAPWAFVGAQDAHAHFYLVTEGAARVAFADRRTPLAVAAGDVLLVAAGTRHTLRDAASGPSTPVREVPWPAGGTIEVPGAGRVTRLLSGCLRVDDPDRDPLWSALPDVLHVRADRVAEIAPLAAVTRLLDDGVSTAGPGGRALAARLADILAIELVREHLRRAAGSEVASWIAASRDSRLEPALTAMHRAPAEPWSVEQLARIAGMSRTAFATRFSALVGRGPLDYLRTLRLHRAAALLRANDDATIGEIAARAGYGSEPAFRRAFKRWARTAPALYRRRHAGVRAEE